MESGNLIHIHRPIVSKVGDRVRLSAAIDFCGVEKTLWFEVDGSYGQYLCAERSDAFLIGLLNFAMRKHWDIRCEAPVGWQLLYQIQTYLIPSLVHNSKILYPTKIYCDADEGLMQNAGGVGTGLSCGVDSLHAVANYSDPPFNQLRLTHLVLNNVGAFYRGSQDNQYQWQSSHARRFCNEYGFKFILTDSNFADVVPQEHLLTHDYSSCFAVYAMQKLWKVYFYGSPGEDFGEYFSLSDSERYDSARYELLLFDVFSTESLRIYSEGGAIGRFEKVKRLIEYPPSYKYLHVCAQDTGPNCGRCKKCLRTLVTLDALGALGRYGECFDLNDYYARRNSVLRWLYRQQIIRGGDVMTREAYGILRDEVHGGDKLAVWLDEGSIRLRKDLICAFPALHRIYRAIFK